MKEKIWIPSRGKYKAYYLYDVFETHEEALKTSKWHNKKNKKNRGWIIAVEQGFLFPEKRYALYMTKIRRLFTSE